MKYTILLFASVLLLANCKKPPVVVQPPPAPSFTETPGPTTIINSFPLKVGNIWAYDNGDTIKAVSDTLINGIATVKLLKINSIVTTASYYTNRADGLYLVATNSSHNWLSPERSMAGSFRIFATPILQVKYNTALESAWNSNDSTYGENNKRKWVYYATITNKAGKFNCTRLSTEIGNISEYYAEKGLIMTLEQLVCITAPCPPRIVNLVYVNF